MTVMAFKYLILISMAFHDYIFPLSPWFWFRLRPIYQTLKAVFDHISKHLEVRQKYSAACRIFHSLLGVWSVVKRGLSCLIYYFKHGLCSCVLLFTE